MDKIEAKVVVKDKYWILKQNKRKVGQLTQEDDGYEVRIKGAPATKITDLSEVQDVFNFVEIKQPNASATDNIYGFPTDTTPYNAMWNLKMRLPLFTKTPDSKSWYAAGWYQIQIKGDPHVEFCPKLITLQRNDYEGPSKQAPEQLVDKLFEEVR